MSQPSLLTILAFAGLVIFILFGVFPPSIVNEFKEIKQNPTSCSLPLLSPKFNVSSIKSGSSSKKDAVELALSFSISPQPVPPKSENRIQYNITLKPVDSADYEAKKLGSGEVVAKKGEEVSTNLSISKKLVVTQAYWELAISARAQSDLDSSIGVDRLYVTFVEGKKDGLNVHVVNPSEYWFSRMIQSRNNITKIPVINQTENSQECGCEKTSWSPIQALRPQPGDGPVDPPQRQISLRFDILVRYELESGGIQRALPNAKVVFFTGDGSNHFYPTWTFQLNNNGRASGVVKTLPDFLPEMAKIYFENQLFTLKTGADINNRQTYELAIDYGQQMNLLNWHLTVNYLVKQTEGPDTGRLWADFQRIRSSGEISVGLWDVPHVEVWYPGVSSRYHKGFNLIEYQTAHTRFPEVAAHEYGHHVMHSLMQNGLPNTPDESTYHEFCPKPPVPAPSVGKAFVEGYATAFGLQVLGQTNYGNLNLGAYSCSSDHDMTTSEGRVAAGLLDLIDDDSAAPECSTNADLGRDGSCDRTRGGELFTPRVVLRDSIIGPQVVGVSAWWERILRTYRGLPGIANGREAMEYNYYPLSCTRSIVLLGRRICLDRIFFDGRIRTKQW